ncbi:hypothetical protein MMC22_003696 [Lobaria immixta]|nr:hypothetical protein [Lobaria immixta]
MIVASTFSLPSGPDSEMLPDILPGQNDDQTSTPVAISLGQSLAGEPYIRSALQSDQTSPDNPFTPDILSSDQTSPDDLFAFGANSLDQTTPDKFFDPDSRSSGPLATSDITDFHLKLSPPGPNEKHVTPPPSPPPTPIKEGSLEFFRPFCYPPKVKVCCHEDVDTMLTVTFCTYYDIFLMICWPGFGYQFCCEAVVANIGFRCKAIKQWTKELWF